MYNSIHHFISFGINKLFSDLEKLVMEGDTDFAAVSLKLKEHLNKLGCSILKEFIESIDDELRDDPERVEKWEVVRKKVKTDLLTIFGTIYYKRTYFKSKQNGEYAFLAERMLDIGSKDKIGADVQISALEEAVDSSYRKGGENSTINDDEISKQSVMNIVKDLEKDKIRIEDKLPDKKKKVKILYVEADEDHVPLQHEQGVAFEKLVYVHEGLEKVSPASKRKRLKNCRYFGGEYRDNEKLWQQVADYIYEHYDWDYIEKIYLAGDGASWIRQGAGWLKNCRFVLDKYHLNEYIKRATGHIDDKFLVQELKDALDEADYEWFDKAFKKIYKATEDERKLKQAKKARHYMSRNWDGIEIYQKDGFDVLGCSAEGHVSHILADRLSSRPLGWSRDRADKITRLRVFKWNGGDIFDLVMKNKEAKKKKVVSERYANKIFNKTVKKKYDEDYSNITVLEKGKRTSIYRVLKTMRGAV